MLKIKDNLFKKVNCNGYIRRKKDMKYFLTEEIPNFDNSKAIIVEDYATQDFNEIIETKKTFNGFLVAYTQIPITITGYYEEGSNEPGYIRCEKSDYIDCAIVYQKHGDNARKRIVPLNLVEEVE